MRPVESSGSNRGWQRPLLELFRRHPPGDPTVNVTHNYYEYRVASVKPNAPVATMAVPDVVRTAVAPTARVESQQLAEGVWLLGGGTHNSLLVAFKDYVAVVDAPNNEARSLAVIAEAARLVPGKPVQYVINTHHHFDHAGGLRTYLSLILPGATGSTRQGRGRQACDKSSTLSSHLVKVEVVGGHRVDALYA
jgi:hypothetical protein